MRYFVILPHLARNGGVKNGVHICHLLNKHGHASYVATERQHHNPYPRYDECKFIGWDECRRVVAADDVFLFFGQMMCRRLWICRTGSSIWAWDAR